MDGGAHRARSSRRSLKGCGVVLIYLIARDEIDDVMDGFVYGAVCGLGFAIVEDVFYFMSVFGGQPAGVLQGFFLRVVASGLYSHVLYTGLVGMAVGVVVSRRAAEPLRPAPLDRRRPVRAGGRSGTSCGTRRCSTLFPAEPWTGADWLMVPVATAVKGLPLLAFVAIAVIARAPARTAVAARGPRRRGRASTASRPTSSDLLASPDAPARRAARRCARRAGSRAALAAPPAPTRTGEPGHGGLAGARRPTTRP